MTPRPSRALTRQRAIPAHAGPGSISSVHAEMNDDLPWADAGDLLSSRARFARVSTAVNTAGTTWCFASTAPTPIGVMPTRWPNGSPSGLRRCWRTRYPPSNYPEDFQVTADPIPTAGFREGRLAAIALARGVLRGDALAIDTLLDADDLQGDNGGAGRSDRAAAADLAARAGVAGAGPAHRRRSRPRRRPAVSRSSLPHADPMARPNRDRPLRTSSGPPSENVTLPGCLAGLVHLDHAPARENADVESDPA